MKQFNAYCRYCHVNVSGNLSGISKLDSGNYLYVGSCSTCGREIRRIIPQDKHIMYPEPWHRHTPKGSDIPKDPYINPRPEEEIADIWATQIDFEE